MDTVFANYPIKPPLVYRVRAFTCTHRTISFLRLWLVAQYARLLVMLGHMVVVVGPPRAGKTVLCSCATDNIIDRRNLPARCDGQKAVLRAGDIAYKVFAIDEPQLLDDASLLDVVGRLANQRHGFLLAAQSIRDRQVMAVCLQWASRCADKRIHVFSLEKIV